MPAMRLPEPKIKLAIQHPEEEVRLTALRYFTDSLHHGDSVMPLVIKAVGTYGVDSAFRILRDAEHLSQAESTISWLIGQLHRRDLDLASVDDDNYRFAVALVLCEADPMLVAHRESDIRKARLFPRQLDKRIAETVVAASWDWGVSWKKFLECADKLSRKRKWSRTDHRRLHHLVRLLARHRDGEAQVLALLRRENHGVEPGLAEWFDSYLVQLAGLMRLDAAIPYIIERSHLAEDDIADECGDALGKIGTNAVVEAIVNDWECGDANFRSIMCSALEKIHTDLCAQTCLELLCDEQDGDVQLELGHALLAHFEFEGVELVQQLVEGNEEDLHADERGLRSRLVAAATIMGATFPEYEEWHDEALRTNYGWFEYERKRIAENFGA
ncbi:MAG: hypothetical protein HYV60_21280 [Planctomycetia bacterium]|nr:hypothetical protein [Planctomycetia bacterium]